jgi:ribosomal protein L16 Arg81 hydroxylase
MTYRVERKKFMFVKGITWNHVDTQFEVERDSHETREDVTLLMGPYDGLFRSIINQMYREPEKWRVMHIYYSRFKQSVTGGRHCDEMNVVIVPSMGRIKYRMDDGEVLLKPGDALYIDSGTYHEAIHLEPRITCSFSSL